MICKNSTAVLRGDSALMLRVYAQAIREEEHDLAWFDGERDSVQLEFVPAGVVACGACLSQCFGGGTVIR